MIPPACRRIVSQSRFPRCADPPLGFPIMHQAPRKSDGRNGGPKSAACGSPRRQAYRPCWRRGRVAEGGGLLNRYRVVKPYRGFESLRLRHPACVAVCSARRSRPGFSLCARRHVATRHTIAACGTWLTIF
jgi:hypothetical protein